MHKKLLALNGISEADLKPTTSLMAQNEINQLQDDTIIELYEENLSLTERLIAQTEINDAQDDSIIEIYELMFTES